MRDCTNFEWTEARCDWLRQLWGDGLSASQCVAEMGGGLSRSSVIGKVHRLKLPQREQDKRSPNGERKPYVRKPYVRKTITGCAAFERAPLQPIAAPHIVDHDIPLEQRRTLIELEWQHCRFPVGDVGTPGFFFWGAIREGGSPYCATHSSRCYDHSYKARRPFIPMRAKVAA